MSLRKSGNIDSSYVMENITCTRASKYNKSYNKKNRIMVISNNDVFLYAQLTKHQYNLIRTRAKMHGCNIYPVFIF